MYLIAYILANVMQLGAYQTGEKAIQQIQQQSKWIGMAIAITAVGAVAEVYETDLPKVRMGQAATLTSVSGGTLKQTLKGTVDEIGLEVAKKDVLNTDPAASIDARVVEVQIRLNPEDSRAVAGLTNMKVQIAIDI